MPAIFLQEPLPLAECESLAQEFPHYDLITSVSDSSGWSSVEVLYGGHLTEEELRGAPRLRWIHSPTVDTEGLCIPEIKKLGNVIVTVSKGKNVFQIAEFVMGAILAFAKQFFLWPHVSRDPSEFMDWPLRDTLWTMHGKILLQIGLGEVGTSVVKLAGEMGMKTWGVRRHRSFHPYCSKTYPQSNLHSLLSTADVVVAALPKPGTPEILLGEPEFELMKPDSIFILVGSGDSTDLNALAKVAATGKFRGVLIDAFTHPPKKKSPLWEIPGVILTPSIARLPESEEHTAFRLFRRNLRFFVPGNVGEMRNQLFESN